MRKYDHVLWTFRIGIICVIVCLFLSFLVFFSLPSFARDLFFRLSPLLLFYFGHYAY